jgi:2',3'-cyclic-nucleotide 2'-phosphodiesterase (5'-nucleotidase family)
MRKLKGEISSTENSKSSLLGKLSKKLLAKQRLPLLLILLVMVVSFVMISGYGFGGANPADRKIQLLWTNDTHGYFMPVYHAEFEEVDSYAATAATEGRIGGYAQIKTLVNKMKAKSKNVLFMDSGDTFDGSPVAQMTRGEAVIPVLNAMGYDAMTPGNRDFAYGKTDFLRVTGMINFPVISMNLRDATTGNLVFPPYLIKQVGDVKVAVVGISGFASSGFVSGRNLVSPNSYQAFQLGPELTDLVTQIRATENPDLVIAISHLGWMQDRKLASEQAGLDAILGAHTHHNIFTVDPVQDLNGKDVIVVQAGSHGKYLGKLELTIKDKEAGRVVALGKYELIRVVSKDIVPDPAVLSVAEAAYAPFSEYLDRVIGSTTTVIERRGDVQSTMSNLLSDAFASIYGVEVSRHFGIRYGSSHIPGVLTVGDVWNMVSPNIGNNGVYVGTITGAAIRSAINDGLNREYGTDPYNWAGGDVTRYNSNVTYTYVVNAGNNAHIVDFKVGNDYLVQNGVNNPTNLAKSYTFAGSSSVGATTPQVLGTTAVDEIIAYIEAQGTVSPQLDNRTVRLD